MFRNKEIHGACGQDKANAEDPKPDSYFWFDEWTAEPIPEKMSVYGLDKLAEVWELVRGVYEGNTVNIPDTGPLGALFQKAHDQYVFFSEREDGEKYLKELDDKRAFVNHNQIKNSFLLPLSDGDASTPIEKRARLIFAAWDGLCDLDCKGQKQVSEASRRSVAEAMKTWPGIRQAIAGFFEKDIPEAGFRLNQKGQQRYAEIFGTRGWVEEIDRFIDDFEKLAKHDRGNKILRLGRFFQAVDALHNGISLMRHEKGAKEPLGGCVTDSAS